MPQREKLSNELWVGVKSQSNLEIAGSPRNSFRTSLGNENHGGRALDGLGGIPAYQTQLNFEYHDLVSGSQAVGDKFHCREGNSPDRRLRS